MKVKLFLGLALSTLMLNSCQTEKVEDTIGKTTAENIPIGGACTFELAQSNPTGKGAIWNWADYRWPNESRIKVKFLGNDGVNVDLKSRIKSYATIWMQHANVNFEFVSSTSNADIKIIAGNEGATGNWSYCGIYCKNIAQNTPSMSIGDLNFNGSESWLRATVIHEFGHALGLIHEHKSPNCDKSKWNKEAIITRYVTQQGWTREKVIEQIFNNEDPYYLDTSSYDRNSIMHYPFSALEMGTTTGIDNRELSVAEINFIKTKYPFPPSTQNVSTIFGEPNLSWTGWVIRLPVGNYTMAQLAARGIPNDAISSLVTNNGYEAVMYFNDNFQGTSKIYTNLEGSFPNMGGIFPYNHDNQYSSVIIRRRL